MISRTDIEFQAQDGVTLRGWLFVPPDDGTKRPAITMAHGFGAVKEHCLERFARAFAEAGFVVLVHDHRSFGSSDGLPRQDVDPWKQIDDWRHAISFLANRPEVDNDRIGLWGTSYSGGHAFILGATDRRLKCIVSQVPTISGFEQGRRRVHSDAQSAFIDLLSEDLYAQHRGEKPRTQSIVSAEPAELAAYRAQEAIDFYLQPISESSWKNSVTLRSTFAARMYEPGIWAARVSPTPLLMVVAAQDTLTLTDLELDAFEKALHPKRLVLIPGGHFAPYAAAFETACGAAVTWFTEHLGATQ
ncbi:alpha/beta hydrolase [Paraburkholderia guartelaensis]|uniref:alpha/beta hydrolase n=1 Tax=Paraburkholderia guartelaensis TaxID=2546446 RepID=UPI002AB76B5B|nr:alpha/beta hydrolase [Paraburkholderia guartelaensis]